MAAVSARKSGAHAPSSFNPAVDMLSFKCDAKSLGHLHGYCPFVPSSALYPEMIPHAVLR